ncbi:hypothetical protein GCM10020254_73530 [Streptomyces goshikiensis]
MELPADFQPWLEHLADPETVAPVALAGAGAEGRLAFYPFADFSPELAAIRWARARGAEVVCCDLPLGDPGWTLPGGAGTPAPGRRPFADALSASGSGRDGEDLWDRAVEVLAPGCSPEAVRRAALGVGWGAARGRGRPRHRPGPRGPDAGGHRRRRVRRPPRGRRHRRLPRPGPRGPGPTRTRSGQPRPLGHERPAAARHRHRRYRRGHGDDRCGHRPGSARHRRRRAGGRTRRRATRRDPGPDRHGPDGRGPRRGRHRPGRHRAGRRGPRAAPDRAR